jgi:TolB-like protein/DNA-binding winged helix-turn-helix (wHTH) protein
LELLILLALREGQLITRSEIADRLWASEVFVDTEHGINTAIRKLRYVLRDDPDDPQFIQTVVGMGYRFIAPVTTVQQPVSEAVLAGGTSVRAASVDPVQPEETIPAEALNGGTALPTRNPRDRAWIGLTVLAVLLVTIVTVTLNAHTLGDRLLHRNAQPAITSLAVIPLENLSGDPNQEYFADGMTDELITMLAKDSTLHITSRTSVMQYKGAHQPLPDIARTLHVGAILEGSVSRSTNRVHMTLQLIRADTDTHLWAESYDRDANDVAMLPDDAARAIANRLNSAAVSSPAARYVNPEAHDAYLRGLYYWYAGPNESAGKYFKIATTLQPDYALGWSGLASYYSLGADTTMDPDEALPKAEESAAKALELDPSLADAHLSMGAIILFRRWDFSRADQEVLRAIELDPQFAQAYHFHAMILASMNRQTEAIEAQKKATALNPYIRPWALPRAFLWARQYDAALQDALPRVDAIPDIDYLNFTVARIYYAKKMDKEAAQFLEKSLLLSNDSKSAPGIKRAYQQGGYRGLVSWQLHQLQIKSKSQFVSPLDQAILYAQLGNREQTFSFLEQSFRKRIPDLVFLQCDPEFDFLHADPRYRSLIQRIGLPSES